MSDLGYQTTAADPPSETIDIEHSEPIDDNGNDGADDSDGASEPDAGDESEPAPAEGDETPEAETEGDDADRGPVEGSVASLLEQAQEEIESLHFDNASLLRDNEVLSSRVASLEDTVESLRAELETSTAREKGLTEQLLRLPNLRAWSVSTGRDTRFVLAGDMVEAAQVAIATGDAPERVLLVPKPIIWPTDITP